MIVRIRGAEALVDGRQSAVPGQYRLAVAPSPVRVVRVNDDLGVSILSTRLAGVCKGERKLSIRRQPDGHCSRLFDEPQLRDQG